MWPKDYKDFIIEEDIPASGTSYRTVTIKQCPTARTCPECDYIHLSKKGHTKPRTIRDVDKAGNKVIINARLQNYQCKDCGKTFTGQLPSCVPEGHIISSDLVDCMVDEFLDEIDLKRAPQMSEISKKYGEHIDTLSNGLTKRITSAKKIIKSMQICHTFILHPFKYGKKQCCALWGLDNRDKPILYDLQEGYVAESIASFLTAHPFAARVMPISAFADLSADILLMLSKQLFPEDYAYQIQKAATAQKRSVSKQPEDKSELVEELTLAGSVGVTRALFADNIQSHRQYILSKKKLGTLRKPFGECMDELYLIVTDDSIDRTKFGYKRNRWFQTIADTKLKEDVEELNNSILRVMSACELGMDTSLEELNPTEPMQFIRDCYNNQYTFSEMCYLVMTCSATRCNPETSFKKYMQRGYIPSSAEGVYNFYTDLEELNAQFSK